MKYETVIVYMSLWMLVSSAPTLIQSTPKSNSVQSVDKLTFLDKHGYEVISNAEEILTPVDQENGVNLSDGIISKPELLLYGRFYVLRKKGLMGTIKPSYAKAANFLKNYPGSSTEKIMKYASSTTESIGLRSQLNYSNRNQNIAQLDKEKDADTIFFPTEASLSTKKYIRHRQTKEVARDQHDAINSGLNLEDLRIRLDGPTSSKSKDEFENKPENLENKREENENEDLEKFDDMSSEEFVDWAQNNLNPKQIAQLVQKAVEEFSAEESEESPTTKTPSEDYSNEQISSVPKIQYNSFILVPGLKCPEGQRMNHKGVCTRKYVHLDSSDSSLPNSSLTSIKMRANRGTTRRKLINLLKSLKTMELQVESALAKDDTSKDDTTIPTTESEAESTTIISLTER